MFRERETEETGKKNPRSEEIISLTYTFHVPVRLLSVRSQMTASKNGKTEREVHEAQDLAQEAQIEDSW